MSRNEIKVNLDVRCKKCNRKRATQNGYCLSCITEMVKEGKFDHIIRRTQMLKTITKTVEQGSLIDVQPKNANEILKAAQEFKSASFRKSKAKEAEDACKATLLDLVKSAGLQPLDNGVIQVRIAGIVITVTPNEESVKVKEEGVPEKSEENGD